MGASARRRSGVRTRTFVAILSTVLIAELFPAAALSAEPTPTSPPEPARPTRPDPTISDTGRVVERPPVELGIPSTSGAGDAAIPQDPSIRPRPGFVPTKAPSVQTAVPDLWTETSRTFANPDGTYTVEVSGGRLNYRDKAGAWRPLDLSLAADANGDYAFRVKAHDRVVRIAAGPAGRSLASLVSSSGRLAIRALDFDASGPAGVPADGVARFRAPGRPDQLFVRGSDRGFEFGATIDSADAAGVYAFALDLGPLTASLAEDGQTVLLTKLSASRVPATVGSISAPIVFDANDIPVADDGVTVELITPGGDRASLSAAAQAELRPNETALVYTIDQAWLDDPDRAFPVTLDPDACLGEGASGCAINGTGTNLDHFVMSGLPTLYPTGWNIIRVGDDARTEPTPQDYGNLRSLVYFADVTLPDGAMVWDTNLRLHISSFGGTPAGQTISVYRIKKGWGQTSTWNDWSSGAGYDTTPVTSVTVPSSGNMNFDVDAIVQSWYTRRAKDWKGDIGFAVRMDYEGSDAGEVGFDRYNDATASYRPLLTIHYEVPKVAIDFDPALGVNYSPSSMIAGQAAVLPVRITNNSSGFDFNTTDWRIGYRFLDAKSVLVSSGSQALTQCVGTGTGCVNPSATIGLTVTPPTTVGQYTLRLDLVRNGSIDTFASDWATPSKFYSRNKKVLSSDNTRWTGSSVVERDEFSIAVVQGGGDTGTVKRIETGNGGSLGVDLWSRNLSYTGAGGVGFDDMLPIELDYGYDSKYVGDCGGILDGCGWWTTFDERLIEGSGTTYTYVDPSGNRHLVDTDPNQQIVSGASVLLQRPRMTLFDEQVPSVTTNLALVSGGSEAPQFTPFSGSWALRATAPTTFPGSTDLGYSRDSILNTYRNVRFAIRTSGATTAAVGFQVKNLTTNASSKWFVYTIGGSADWAAGDDHLWLGTGVTVGSGGWTYIARNLYQDVRDADLGGTTDEYRMDAMRVYYKSGLTGTHRTYLDALRLESAESTIVEDNDPVFTTGDSLATLVTNDVVAGTSALKVQVAALTSSPNCTTTNSCWSTSAGGLWSYAFAHWQWKKVGGRTAAVVFHFKDERTNATGDLTYYAGPTPPAGAVNAIQVSDVAPEHWTKVTVNILEDARQVLNFYNDGPKTTTPGAPPSQGPTADDVRLTGYRLSAVDGNFLLIDDFDYGSLPSIGNDMVDHPNSASDTTFTYDFTATYPNGSIHYFNTRGLLTRIADRDGNRLDFAWSIPDPTVYGTAGFRLDAIRPSTDGTTSASGTYDRELRLTYSGTVGTAGRSVTVEERLGTVATPVTGRRTVFTFSAANDVIALKPARTPGSTCPASGPSGCDLFTYDTSHLLTMVGDPRWDQQTSGGNDYRFEITWSGGAPAAIVDRSQPTDTEILKVLTYDVTGLELPAASRAAWQDAAAIRSSNALIEDLTSEGRQLFTYIPRACTTSPCTSVNLPTVGTTARATESQFDGLARETTTIAYRCPGVAVSGCTGTTAQKVVSRQGTKAGAKVNNYNDPLTAGQVGWSQSPDQHVASLRDSGGLGPDLYRTFYAYDDNGQQVEAARSAYNARTSYSAAIKSTTQSSTALKGYWRLGDTTTTATDQASSPHNGTYSNGAVFGRPDALVNDADTAAGFDGTNDYVAIPGTFPQINGSFSVEAWVRPDVQTATLAFIGSRKSTTSTTDFTFDAKLHYDTTAKVRNVRLDIGDGTQWLLNVNFPFDWQANRWYHIAAIVDDVADTGSIAVNGELIGTQKFTIAGTPKLSDATRVLKIGNNGRDSTTPEWFDGDIDEVAIWQQVLTRVQVEGHYLAGLSASLMASQTLYDDSWRPIQVDDQMLANAGFESLLTDWDFGQGSGGTVYAATSTSDPKVHQPSGANLPPSWASFNTGLTGNVQQDVQLVPGQTVRLQVWETRLTSTTAFARVNLYYWRRSDGSWQALVNKAYQNASWTGHAWDVTLPWDTDGRVRVALWISGAAAGDTVYFDDAALFTTYGRTTYTTTPFKGLIDEVVTLSPTQDGPIAEFRARNTYGATVNHPAIFATAVTQNYENGTFIASAPDQDVTTTTTYDAWGHELTKTDQDGVATTTAYEASSAANGYATDVASSTNGMNEPTTYTYDLVGNQLTETTPMLAPNVETTTTTYDLRGHALTVTAPAPIGTVTKSIYDGFGYLVETVDNYVDGTPSGHTGVDDLRTTYTYDEFGAQTSETRNAGLTGTGAVAARNVTTHDLLGNTVSTTAYSTFNGTTFGGERVTRQYFEVVSGTSRPKASAQRGPDNATGTGTLVPTAAPAPLCPDGSGTRCNGVTALDQNGQAIAVTDVYGKVTRTLLDIAGKTVFSIENYQDGTYDSAAPDTDVITTTQLDLYGRAAIVIDTLNRKVTTRFDALGRPTRVTNTGSDGSTGSEKRTVYTGGGRTDRVSSPGASSAADSALSWTRTIYDKAGRAIRTLAHYDIAGNAGLAIDAFETPETDITINNDGTTERWLGGAQTFTLGGSIAREAAAASTTSGGGRLAVTTGTGGTAGTEWALDGTFVGGHAYKARIWVNAPAGTSVTATLGVSGDSAPAATPVAGNGAWQPLDVTWTPTAARTGARLAVYRAAAASSVTFYLDDATAWDSASGATDVNIPTETAYDRDGRVVASIVAPGTVGTTELPMVTRTAFDALGRTTSVTVNEIAGAGTGASDVNLASLTHYDALGRTDTNTDPSGTVTRFDYDRLGRATATTLNHVDGTAGGAATADDVKSTFAYNAAGEMVGYCPAVQVFVGGCAPETASNPQAWHYAYDEAGHITLQTPPVHTSALTQLATSRWEYDAGGRVTKSCDIVAGTASCSAASGVHRAIVPTYDGVGRTTRNDVFSGATTLGLRTDTSYFGDGKTNQIKYFEGSTPTLKDTIDQQYDAFGRLQKVLRNGTTTLSEFSYNTDDTVAWRKDGDAGAIGQSTYGYDWAKRLTSVQVPTGFATATAGFTWRLDGLVKSRTWSTSTSATFSYDGAKRPIGIGKGSNTQGQAFDRDGNVTSETRSFQGVTGDAGTNTQTFDYDGLNRIVQSSGLASGQRTYAYDRNGNRLTKSEGGSTFTYVYDRTDEVVSVIKTGGTLQNFVFDARGNMTGNAETATGVTTLTYDVGNKLTGIDAALTANDATFTFDALGRFATRVLPAASGTDTYSYVGTDEVVTRIANSVTGNTDSIVTPAGDRLGVKVGSTVNWFLPDLHGDIAASLSQDEATVVNAVRYDAYGQTITTGTAGGTRVGDKAWKYQGRLDISPDGLGTPLYDMSARFYNPGLGAFTQLDTVMGKAQDPMSMNRFLYASANPATLTDPTGHCPFCIILIPIAIGFFAGAGTDAVVQQVTTGHVDLGQAAVSGVIGSFTGGVGGVAAAGVKSVALQAARPIVQRLTTTTVSAVVSTGTEQAINSVVYPQYQQPGFGESAATNTAIGAGTDLLGEGARRLPGRAGRIGALIDGFLGGQPSTPKPAVSAAVPGGPPIKPRPSTQTGSSGLLPGEGDVGTYRDLLAAGSKGDNLTPNHMPQAAYMEEVIPGWRRNDGVTMNMEQPAVGGRHRETISYGRQPDLTKTPRQVLAAEIRDARRIYMRHRLYTPVIRTGLRQVITQNRQQYPRYFAKHFLL